MKIIGKKRRSKVTYNQDLSAHVLFILVMIKIKKIKKNMCNKDDTIKKIRYYNFCHNLLEW